MARLPEYVRRIETVDGIRYEARINVRRGGGRRTQLRKRCKQSPVAVRTRRGDRLRDG